MRAVKRLGRAHAGRRDDNVLFDVFGRRLGKLHAIKLGAAVEAPQQERQRLAEMAEHHLGAGKAIEQSAEHQPQRVRAGLKAPLPGGAAQAVDAFQRGRRRNRIGRMDIDRRAQRLGALPENMQRRMVEILAMGMAVDHGAAEFQVAHATLQLIGGAARVLHRQVSKAGIAVRPLLHFTGEKIVRLPGARSRRSSASRSLCTPGPAIASTERAMPASSMDCRRISPKSVSRAWILAAHGLGRRL